jgi:hypothetical protein
MLSYNNMHVVGSFSGRNNRGICAEMSGSSDMVGTREYSYANQTLIVADTASGRLRPEKCTYDWVRPCGYAPPLDPV